MINQNRILKKILLKQIFEEIDKENGKKETQIINIRSLREDTNTDITKDFKDKRIVR